MVTLLSFRFCFRFKHHSCRCIFNELSLQLRLLLQLLLLLIANIFIQAHERYICPVHFLTRQNASTCVSLFSPTTLIASRGSYQLTHSRPIHAHTHKPHCHTNNIGNVHRTLIIYNDQYTLAHSKHFIQYQCGESTVMMKLI